MEFEIPEPLFTEPVVRQRSPSRFNNEMPDPPMAEEPPADQVSEPYMWGNHSAPTEACL